MLVAGESGAEEEGQGRGRECGRGCNCEAMIKRKKIFSGDGAND